MQLDVEKLETIKKKLKNLAKSAEIDLKKKYLQNYQIRSSEYRKIFKNLEETLKSPSRKEKLKSLDLNIPVLSEEQIQGIISNGMYDAKLGSYLHEVQKSAERLLSLVEETIEMQENVRTAQALLEDSYNEMGRAKTLIEKRDWNGSIESSQHSIEHSIKSVFSVVGENFSHKHDPTDELDKVMKKLQSSNIRPNYSFLLEAIARIRWIAKVWAKIHTESMYPYYDIPAKKFFKEKDAKILREYAEDVYYTCNGFKKLIENETIKFNRIRKPPH